MWIFCGNSYLYVDVCMKTLNLKNKINCLTHLNIGMVHRIKKIHFQHTFDGAEKYVKTYFCNCNSIQLVLMRQQKFYSN